MFCPFGETVYLYVIVYNITYSEGPFLGIISDYVSVEQTREKSSVNAKMRMRWYLDQQ